jgi:hypothetical protein
MDMNWKGCERNWTWDTLRYFLVKVKQSLYTPAQALRAVGFQAARIASKSAHEDGKFVILRHRPPLPVRRYSLYAFLLQAGWTAGP